MFKHPRDVCMTYIEHVKVSFMFSGILFKGAFKSIVHAFLPDVYVTCVTDAHKQIGSLLLTTGCDEDITSESETQTDDSNVSKND